MNQPPLIVSVAKTIDKKGDMQHIEDMQSRIVAAGFDIEKLVIEPLGTDWHAPEKKHHFKSGCAPVEALAKAVQLIGNGHHAVLISGDDDLKTGYSKQQRKALMAVYDKDYPLTQAYTDLAKQFMAIHEIETTQFKHLCELLFDNHKRSFSHPLNSYYDENMLPDNKWYGSITDLYRGVDCANPLVDFSGRVLICSVHVAEQLDLNLAECIEVAGVSVSKLEGDGRNYIEQIATYQHLKEAYEQSCAIAKVDFNRAFAQGQALLEVYTCYPVVPLGFLLAGGLVDNVTRLDEFIKQYNITITGGMNLARAPWNNPALNGIISMVERILASDEQLGLVHANGGLGYRQGIAILRQNG